MSVSDRAFSRRTSTVNNAPLNPRHIYVKTWAGKFPRLLGTGIVDWPNPAAAEALVFFKSIDHIGSWVLYPGSSDKLLDAHIVRLSAALEFWAKELKNKFVRPAIDPLEVICRNLAEGPAFAEELSDCYKYTYRLKVGYWGGELQPCDKPTLDTKRGEAIFPAAQLIPFRMEDPEDWRLSMEKPPSTDSFDWTGFREHVQANLKEGVEIPPEDAFDALTLLGNEKTFFHGKTMTKNMYLSEGYRPSLTDKFVFKYSPVQKNAEEFRCAITATPDTLYTHRLCMEELNLIKNCKIDKMGIRDVSWLPAWLSRSGWYLMLDQKKCGLTINRKLLYETIRAIEELYPQTHLDLIISGYENNVVHLPNARFKMERGVGLGMVNELVSFAMACLMSFFFQNNSDQEYQGLVFNDDQVIFSSGEIGGDCEEDFIKWKSFMASAGLYVHETKSFVGETGVFLEQYGAGPRWYCSKDLRIALSAFYALHCPFIGEAKELIASMGELDFFQTATFYRAVERVIELMGYEFESNEVSYPFPIGWYTRREEGVNQFFKELDTPGVNRDRFWAVAAVGLPPIKGEGRVLRESDPLGGVFLNDIRLPANNGRWHAQMKAWSEKRAWAFKHPRPVDKWEVYERYNRMHPDKWVLSFYPPADQGLATEELTPRHFAALAKHLGLPYTEYANGKVKNLFLLSPSYEALLVVLENAHKHPFAQLQILEREERSFPVQGVFGKIPRTMCGVAWVDGEAYLLTREIFSYIRKEEITQAEYIIYSMYFDPYSSVPKEYTWQDFIEHYRAHEEAVLREKQLEEAAEPQEISFSPEVQATIDYIRWQFSRRALDEAEPEVRAALRAQYEPEEPQHDDSIVDVSDLFG